VDILTNGPTPVLPMALTNMRIASKAWMEKNGAAKPQNFSAKEDTFVSRNAYGTGHSVTFDGTYRIAVAGANTGGSGSFTWQQHGTKAQVQMHGPIGIGSLKLTLTDETIRIETADGQIFEADEAQSELTARLGASVSYTTTCVGVRAPLRSAAQD
jgi:outer membrane biogenesis lipoprotein LolB